MNKYWFIFLYLFLGGCGTFGQHEEVWMRKDFIKYYNNFLLDAIRHNKKLEIKQIQIDFGKLKSPVIGECRVSKGYKTIIIDPDEWFHSSNTRHKELIYHELGHCLLNRDHFDTAMVINNVLMPASLMSTIMLNEYFFEEYEDYYINELFLW